MVVSNISGQIVTGYCIYVPAYLVVGWEHLCRSQTPTGARTMYTVARSGDRRLGNYALRCVTPQAPAQRLGIYTFHFPCYHGSLHRII